MLAFGNKEFRNLQEQVLKNMDDIAAIEGGAMVIGEFGIKVIGNVANPDELPDPAYYGGEFGDAYLVGTEAPYDYYIYTRAFENDDTPQWINIGIFPAPGPMGPQGPAGQDGAQGPRGLQGPTGLTGPQGLQGPQGQRGEKGEKGDTGDQGPRGETGFTYVVVGQTASAASLPSPTIVPRNSAYLVGAEEPYDLYVVIGSSELEWFDAGPVALGPRGPQGIQGPKGDKGDTGDTGPRGPQGIQGEQGVQGPQGPTGATGPEGPQGPKGATGPQGDTGPTGPKGDKGDKGDTGEKGETGEQGPKGDKGDTGDTGPQGPQGIQGIQGPKGDTGDPFAIYAIYSSVAAMEADAARVPEGKFVLISSTESDPDNAKLYVKNNQGSFTFLTDLSGAQGIQGPAGPQGPQGVQGETGPKGDTGATGETGATGATGPQGPQGIQGEPGDTPYIDSETGNWFVSDRDTGVHAQGPQGIQGVQGLQGPTGPQGPQGIQGPAGTNGDTSAISVNGQTFTPVNGTITLPDYSNTPDIDNKTIVVNSDGDLETAAGGYSEEIATQYWERVVYSGPARDGATNKSLIFVPGYDFNDLITYINNQAAIAYCTFVLGGTTTTINDIPCDPEPSTILSFTSDTEQVQITRNTAGSWQLEFLVNGEARTVSAANSTLTIKLKTLKTNTIPGFSLTKINITDSDCADLSESPYDYTIDYRLSSTLTWWRWTWPEWVAAKSWCGNISSSGDSDVEGSIDYNQGDETDIDFEVRDALRTDDYNFKITLYCDDDFDWTQGYSYIQVSGTSASDIVAELHMDEEEVRELGTGSGRGFDMNADIYPMVYGASTVTETSTEYTPIDPNYILPLEKTEDLDTIGIYTNEIILTHDNPEDTREFAEVDIQPGAIHVTGDGIETFIGPDSVETTNLTIANGGVITINNSDGSASIDLDYNLASQIGGGGTPTNMMTTDTAQTITGAKMFSNYVRFGPASGAGYLYIDSAGQSLGGTNVTALQGSNGFKIGLAGWTGNNGGLILGGSAGNSIRSYQDNIQNLGRSDYRWKDLYLAGNLSDGTNTATVADIAALITYAKGQGWIS